MRQPKMSRAERRMMERRTVNPTVSAVTALQMRRGNRDRKALDEQIIAGITRMQDRVRTLRYDEGAKAHTADSQAQTVLGAATLNLHAINVEETTAKHLIPRRSLSVKLALALRAPLMQFETRVWKQLDKESKARLAADHRAVMKAHPDTRAKLAKRLAEETGPTLRYIAGSDERMVWKSDGTLLIPWKIQTLATVKVKRHTADERTIEQESEALPTWKDENGNTVDPNFVDFDTATIQQEQSDYE